MKSPLGRLEVAVGPHFQDRLAAIILNEKPEKMIETGLETGFGAEFYIVAMHLNEKGHLWSVDPEPHFKYKANPIVDPRFTFVKGMSQDVLPKLLEEIGPVDIFLHDSDHGPECQEFEYEMAWKHVRPGGIIASDDPFWGMPPHFTWDKFLQRHGVKDRHIIGNAQWIRKP